MNKFYLLTVLAASVWSQALAGHVSVAEAHRAAGEFINQRVAAGSFRAPAGAVTASLTLAHTETSQAVEEANDYYAFNVTDGGWVIVAGEDRARPVLAYSDRGHLDFDRLPCTFRAVLDGYKREIEFLHTYDGDDLVPASATSSAGRTRTIGPLITSTWGQEMPYNLQCPKYRNQYSVVGCVATAMAQVMRYWEYPQSSSAISSYYCYSLGQTVGALPATTFDYRLMLDSYCHWDWTNNELVQDTYTDAQAQAAAKLSRYCGQAVRMSYSPDGSGAYTSNQLDAMKGFGYRSSAQLVRRTSYYYTTAEWEAMIKTELNAGRPILYSADDTNGTGGHAFICDGYNSDGMFHFNMGWYGTCDGWYASTALNMTHRDGDELRYNSGQEMITNLLPPEGWVRPSQLPSGDVNGDGQVDITDVNAACNVLLGKVSNDQYGGRADVDADGEVNITDINAIINAILGLQDGE